MKNYWLDEAKKRLRAESSKSSEVQLERLQEQGIINDRGEVTGQLRRWNAFLAITAVKRVAGTREIAVFSLLETSVRHAWRCDDRRFPRFHGGLS